MNIIYMYELDKSNDTVSKDLPCGCKILTAQERHGKIVIWVLFDETDLKTKVDFIITKTGVPSITLLSSNYRYLNTIQSEEDGSVYHVFYKKCHDVKGIE